MFSAKDLIDYWNGNGGGIINTMLFNRNGAAEIIPKVSQGVLVLGSPNPKCLCPMYLVEVSRVRVTGAGRG